MPSRPTTARPGRSRPLRPLVAALTLVLLAAPLPLSGGATLGITEYYRIQSSVLNPEQRFEAFDATTLAVADLDGDGGPEILTHNDNNWFYVFGGSAGHLLAETTTNHPSGWQARELAGPAVGDLDGDNRPDIVLTNSAGWVTAFEARTPQTGGIALDKLWEKRMDPHEQDPNYAQNMPYGTWSGHPPIDGPVFLADPDGDGRDAAWVQLDGMPSHFRLTGSGTVDWWTMGGDGNSGPVVGDLNGDGALEVVFASDGGRIFVYDAHTMNLRCQFRSRDHGASPGSISVAPSLADVNGDGGAEIVFGVRNVHSPQTDPDWIDRSHAYFFAVKHDCSLLWKLNPTWANPHIYMMPVAHDISGDGRNDLLFFDWNTIGHKPGNWETTGKANLFAVRGDTGALLWRTETSTYWSNKNIAVADVTGDSALEILVNEEQNGRDGIGLYSLSGQRVGHVPAPQGWIVSRGPIVAALGHDDRQYILLPVHKGATGCPVARDVGCREGAIQVYRTESFATPVYSNSHPLARSEPGDPGAFSATFPTVKGNNWWVETVVQGNRPIQKVEVSVNSGNWIDLPKTSWGAWAKSTHVPTGSVVQLRAHSNEGTTSLSGCYTWTAATSTTCPGTNPSPTPTQSATPSPTPTTSASSTPTATPTATASPSPTPTSTTPSGFTATFSNVRGNNWWIETEASGNQAIASVHASVNSGTWTELPKTSWGSYAKSMSAPEGSVVRLRATATGGATALSGCYAWTAATATTCPGGSPSPSPTPTASATPTATASPSPTPTTTATPGTFTATYSNVRGNTWWIEVDVTGSESIAGVSARVNGGTWKALDATSWGSWAKSINAPSGSTVEFRATSGTGATHMSSPYTWPPA